VEEHLSTTNKTLDSLPCKNQKTKKDKTLLGQTLVEAHLQSYPAWWPWH
jgi:hypothetical protein